MCECEWHFFLCWWVVRIVLSSSGIERLYHSDSCGVAPRVCVAELGGLNNFDFHFLVHFLQFSNFMTTANIVSTAP